MSRAMMAKKMVQPPKRSAGEARWETYTQVNGVGYTWGRWASEETAWLNAGALAVAHFLQWCGDVDGREVGL